MSGLIKIIVTFVICIVSFTLGVVSYKFNEYSPFVFIFIVVGMISFLVSIVGFMMI